MQVRRRSSLTPPLRPTERSRADASGEDVPLVRERRQRQRRRTRRGGRRSTDEPADGSQLRRTHRDAVQHELTPAEIEAVQLLHLGLRG